MKDARLDFLRSIFYTMLSSLSSRICRNFQHDFTMSAVGPQDESSRLPGRRPSTPAEAVAPGPGSFHPPPGAIARLRRLVTLFHHRWSAPILAQLELDDGGRFVTLQHRLDVNRDSLHTTLEQLIRRGWVMRNPGYGHPLRPEYLLTEEGRAMAPACAALMKTLDRTGIVQPALRKWSMPVAMGVNWGAERFGALRLMLPQATNRALALALKDLQGVQVVNRRVLDDYPPTPLYALTRRGRNIAAVLADL
jgi:DNA-binding HxlR family transcriptional regulator